MGVEVSLTISGLSRLFGGDLAGVLDVARTADDFGIHQLALPDHVVMGSRLDRYPFAERFPYPPEEPWLEPLTTLAAVAGATQRVRLATSILVAPLRPAVLLAKAAATLDVLSAGRLDLGVGAGWQPEEFDAAGAHFAGRGEALDDIAGLPDPVDVSGSRAVLVADRLLRGRVVRAAPPPARRRAPLVRRRARRAHRQPDRGARGRLAPDRGHDDRRPPARRAGLPGGHGARWEGPGRAPRAGRGTDRPRLVR